MLAQRSLDNMITHPAVNPLLVALLLIQQAGSPRIFGPAQGNSIALVVPVGRRWALIRFKAFNILAMNGSVVVNDGGCHVDGEGDFLLDLAQR
jgi:hypothetical protein